MNIQNNHGQEVEHGKAGMLEVIINGVGKMVLLITISGMKICLFGT